MCSHGLDEDPWVTRCALSYLFYAKVPHTITCFLPEKRECNTCGTITQNNVVEVVKPISGVPVIIRNLVVTRVVKQRSKNTGANHVRLPCFWVAVFNAMVQDCRL